MVVRKIAISNSGRGSEALQGGLMLLPIEVVPCEKKFAIDNWCRYSDRDELMILRGREAAKKCTVPQATHGRSRADCQWQGQNGNCREARILPKLTRGVPNILGELVHHLHPHSSRRATMGLTFDAR